MSGILNPCPLCGAMVAYQACMGEVWVSCAVCGAFGPMHATFGRAADAWNRGEVFLGGAASSRAAPPSPAAAAPAPPVVNP